MIPIKSTKEEELFLSLDRTFSMFNKRITHDYWTPGTAIRVPNGCCGLVRQVRRNKGSDVVVAVFKVKIKERVAENKMPFT